MKKLIGLTSVLALSAFVLGACGSNDKGSEGAKDDKKGSVVQVAALESAYGAEMWEDVKAAYEEQNPDVTVELTLDKKLEDVISPNMKAGKFPDVILLGVGREAGLTETFIKDKNMEDLTDMLAMKVPGEDKTVSEKLIPGFTDSLVTNPYGDDKTFLSPMFYAPTGLFYNAGLLEEKGWEVPTTWDEMWELGEKAKKEDIALFTYPVSGYLDTFFSSLLSTTGGPELFNSAMTYEKGAWDSKEATEAFEILDKLAKYTAETTVANANHQDFTKNQQLILDNKAIFMPNGTWVPEEMKDAPRADGFKWGMTALPAQAKDSDRYSYTFFEQAWMPAGAENKEAGKEFMAFLYSDKAAEIFKKAGAIQPIEGMSDGLEGEQKLFYSIYDGGAKAVMGGLSTSVTVEGVDMHSALYDTYNSVVTGDKTVTEWQDTVVETADKLREAAE